MTNAAILLYLYLQNFSQIVDPVSKERHRFTERIKENARNFIQFLIAISSEVSNSTEAAVRKQLFNFHFD